MSEAAALTTAADVAKRREQWLWAGLIVILALVVYQPAIRGGFIWDDERHVTQNRALRDGEGLRKIWFEPSHGTPETYVTPQYYPMTHTTYWVEYHLWGLNPTGYHLVNVLLHAGSALLLWRVLVLLGVPGAWVAGVIFAIHPIEVESVAWITERKNVLSGAFFLGAMYAYLRFAGLRIADGGLRNEEKQRWGWYALALALFCCAVLSKTVAGALPFVLVLLLWWKKKLGGRELAGLTPFVMIGVVMGRKTAWMEKNVVGAMGADWDLSFTDRLLVAGKAFWFYLGKLVWPVNLTFTYPRWEVGDKSAWVFVIAAALLLVAAGVWWLVGKGGRGVAAAVLAYAVMLFPALGFFNVYPMRYSFVADHFQYLAGMAVIAVVVGVLAKLFWKGEQSGSAKPVQVVTGLVVFVLAVAAWRQSRVYASMESLWRDTIAKNPTSWMGLYNLGHELMEQARIDRMTGAVPEAKKKMEEASELFAKTVALRENHEGAWSNWGSVLLDLGRPKEAREKFEKAIAIGGESAEDLSRLALADVAMGEVERARAEYERALQLSPDSQSAHRGLAQMAGSKQDWAGAERHFRAAVESYDRNLATWRKWAYPPFPTGVERAMFASRGHQGLGGVLLTERKFDEAAREFVTAARLLEEGARDAATAERTIDVTGEMSRVLTDAGSALAQAGKRAEAMDLFNRATAVNPDYLPAYVRLGYLYGEMGAARKSEAFEAFRRALTIDPTNKEALAGAELLIKAEKLRQQAATTRSSTTTRAATTGRGAATTVPTTGPQ